jgi:hypothetical protein
LPFPVVRCDALQQGNGAALPPEPVDLVFLHEGVDDGASLVLDIADDDDAQLLAELGEVRPVAADDGNVTQRHIGLLSTPCSAGTTPGRIAPGLGLQLAAPQNYSGSVFIRKNSSTRSSGSPKVSEYNWPKSPLV